MKVYRKEGKVTVRGIDHIYGYVKRSNLFYLPYKGVFSWLSFHIPLLDFVGKYTSPNLKKNPEKSRKIC